MHLRFSGSVKASEIADWAGLWMRVDGTRGAMLGFDSMQDRPIKGSVDWKPYAIVLDWRAAAAVSAQRGRVSHGSRLGSVSSGCKDRWSGSSTAWG